MNSQMYDFFVLDHSARWKAMAWSVVIGTLAGFFTSDFLGLYGSAGLTVVCCVGAMMIFMARYSHRSQRTLSPFKTYKRREALRLSAATAVSATLLLFDWLWTASTAIAFADSATDAIRKGEVVSPLRTAIAKRVIEGRMVEHQNKPELQKAYAQINAVANYYEVRDTRSDVRPIPSDFATSPSVIDKAITVQGPGKARYSVAVGPMRSIFVIKGRAFTLQSIDFQTDAEPAPSVFQFVGTPDVVVKDCAFHGFRQSLDNVTWIDVDFYNCVLDSSALMNVTLVNVSFINCKLPPALVGTPNPVSFSSPIK